MTLRPPPAIYLRRAEEGHGEALPRRVDRDRNVLLTEGKYVNGQLLHCALTRVNKPLF